MTPEQFAAQQLPIEGERDPVELWDIQAPPLDDEARDLDALCEAWVLWRVEHRLYAASTFARLPGTSTRPLQRPAWFAAAADLSSFHVAYTCQPDALDKQVFDLFYLARIKPVKTVAAHLGITSRQFYRVLDDFRRRVETAARAFRDNTLATNDPHTLPLLTNHDGAVSVNTESESLTRHKTQA